MQGATSFTAHGNFHHKNQTIKKATSSFSPRINDSIYDQKKPDHLANCSSPGISLNFV